MSLSLLLFSKAKRNASVLKKQAKVAAIQAKARASSAVGTHKKGGKNYDGNNKGAKDQAKKVRKNYSRSVTHIMSINFQNKLNLFEAFYFTCN